MSYNGHLKDDVPLIVKLYNDGRSFSEIADDLLAAGYADEMKFDPQNHYKFIKYSDMNGYDRWQTHTALRTLVSYILFKEGHTKRPIPRLNIKKAIKRVSWAKQYVKRANKALIDAERTLKAARK